MGDVTVLSMKGEFKQIWDKIILEEKAKYDAWIKDLKRQGVKCAMPGLRNDTYPEHQYYTEVESAG